MNIKFYISLLACGLLAACSSGGLVLTTTPYPTYTSVPTYTLVPTYTPYPTYTDLPPAATEKPSPTFTLTETQTTEVTPEPIKFIGKSDDVLKVDSFESGILHIIGNSESRYFSVEGISSTGETVDLFVNTSDPYDGYRPFNWLKDEISVRLRITAVGQWEIQYHKLPYGLHIFNAPGIYEGIGDQVIIIDSKNNDVAHVKGNSKGRYFSITAYLSEGQELLISTSDPYEGTILIPPRAFIFDIQASGPWTIEITEP